MNRIEFTLREPYPLLNRMLSFGGNARAHFGAAKRRKLAIQSEIFAATIGSRPATPLPFARIYVERRSTGSPDIDGLYGGIKPLLDCLSTPRALKGGRVKNEMGLAFIVDDDAAHLDLKVVAVKVRRADRGTFVRIEA